MAAKKPSDSSPAAAGGGGEPSKTFLDGFHSELRKDPEITRRLVAGDVQGALDLILSKARESEFGIHEQYEELLKTQKFNPANLDEIRNAAREIRSKMRSRTTSHETLLASLFVIAEYANLEDYMRPVAEAGVLDTLYLLATYPNKDIQMTSLYILSELAIDDSNAVRFQKEGAVSLALKAGESEYELSRIYSVKLLGELAKVPECNSSLSLYLLQNQAFVKNLLWMHRFVKPYKLKMILARKFYYLNHELCLLSARALGMLVSSKETTKRAEELELFDPLIEYASKGFNTPQQKVLFQIITWTFGRALSTGGLNRDRLVIGNIYKELQGQLPAIITKANIFSDNQVPFVPVPAPEFSYEVVSDFNQMKIKDPSAVTKKLCALLSCNKQETAEMKLSMCAGCRLSYYCCREHQVQDWKEGHKQRCRNQKKE